MSSNQSIRSEHDVLTIFKQSLLDFFEALIEILPQEGDLYLLLVLFQSMPMENAMKVFAKRIVPYQDFVKNKDERFFIECTDLFAGLRKEKVSYFKDLWLSGTLGPEDKQSLWEWFAKFLALAQKYIKLTNLDINNL